MKSLARSACASNYSLVAASTACQAQESVRQVRTPAGRPRRSRRRPIRPRQLRPPTEARALTGAVSIARPTMVMIHSLPILASGSRVLWKIAARELVCFATFSLFAACPQATRGAPHPQDPESALAARTAELALRDVAAAMENGELEAVRRHALAAWRAIRTLVQKDNADLDLWQAAGRVGLALKSYRLCAAAYEAIKRLQPDFSAEPKLLDLMAALNLRPLTGFLDQLQKSRATFLRELEQSDKFINSLSMEFVPVSGTDVHFSVWETRVQDYQVFAQQTGRDWDEPSFPQGPTHPAVNVSWLDAKAFCDWLTREERKAGWLDEEQGYRLPTDAEWSWALGIGDRETRGTPKEKDGKVKNVYPWGTKWPPPNGAGNYDGGLDCKEGRNFVIAGYRDGYTHTAPVGSFPPKGMQLFDLGGNVAEWCEDWESDERRYRVFRGGAWVDVSATSIASSARDSSAPQTRHSHVGFRVVWVNGTARR
jgi:tetratricopeptide (TPR) repeat protein